MRVATAICCATLILAIGSCGVTAGPLRTVDSPQSGDRRDVERFLAKWFQLEERQAYREIYSRLSRRFKAELRQEENVRTAAGYARLRRSSEARWFGFELREIKMASPARAEALLTATIEETGERETVAVRCVLRREGGRWTLDAWDY